MDLLQILKALADETRLRILNLLRQGELCVCELEEILEINQSNASRHLNKLMNAKLISYEKRALYVYYSLSTEAIKTYPFLETLIIEEIGRLDRCRVDSQKLIEYKRTGIGCDELKQKNSCKN